MSRSTIARGLGFVGAAFAGGTVALVGAAALGQLPVRGTTTVRVIEPEPIAAPSPAIASQSVGGLTIGQIYERSKSGVVQVNARVVIRQPDRDPIFGLPFGAPEEQRREGIGSGFVIDRVGHIVTNFHVVADADEVTVSFSNRDRVRARIVGVDASTDVAVLKVDEKSRALSPLTLGRSSTVRVGDPVVAIGNPFGLERSVTAGIVSALQRRIAAPNLAGAIDEVIQTDALVNEGNSGGPLLNARGEVIGVNTAFVAGGGNDGAAGISFAIPIDTVRAVAAQLIEDGRVARPFLGVGVQEINDELAQVFRLPVERGLIVQEVRRGSAADRAGLRAGSTSVVVSGESYVLGGDVIVRVAGRPVATENDLRRVVNAHRPGDAVKIEVYRGDTRLTLTAELDQQPTSSG
ncbi:MAG TPA: trypsin-like peptidase domain-containing protein [Gaiellaceae bacterium]|nr:trypsin-like peptidase domain-containing protein [Gaiellaceae bacterium]